MTEPAIGNTQQQILDALTILTTPKMVVEDPNKLRDQFAMAALRGCMDKVGGFNPAMHAEDAYAMADAMIEARGKK